MATDKTMNPAPTSDGASLPSPIPRPLSVSGVPSSQAAPMAPLSPALNSAAVSAPTETVTEATVAKPKRAKFVAMGLVGGALVVGTIVYLLGQGKQSTDDAQVEGHVMSIAARVTGQVEKVMVQDNQRVNVGDVLVELDKSELVARLDTARADLLSAQASLTSAQANLALMEKTVSANLQQAQGGLGQAASGVSSSRAGLEQARADIAAAEARNRLARLDLDRARSLRGSGAVAQAELDSKQAAYDQAAAALDTARARLDSTKAGLEGGYAGVEQARGRFAQARTGPEQVAAAGAAVGVAQARVKQSEAALRLAELNLSYASIRAPMRGVVSRRTVEVGNLVSPDRPLLAVVSLDDVWVVANFKEDQVGKMKAGQPARIEVDAYGSKEFSGHLDSLAAGTGSRFALLPPDNASGNFVKVSQRIPVLVRFDNLGGTELRPGMSASVVITTR